MCVCGWVNDDVVWVLAMPSLYTMQACGVGPDIVATAIPVLHNRGPPLLILYTCCVPVCLNSLRLS